MITINFSPVRSDAAQLTASLNGLILTVNSVEYNLDLIEDGATVEHEVIKNCTRSGGDFELTLTLPHGSKAPYETRFPEAIKVKTDGEIDIPVYNIVEVSE